MIEMNFFGKDAKFEHIGLVVQSIKEATPEAEVVKDERQNVMVSFILISGIKIELIEPLDNDSAVTESLQKGQKLLHLCFLVPDIDLALKEGRNNGFHCIAKPVPAAAFNNKKIAWLFSRTYGLFELLEE